uniref:Claudin-10-like n=1 Tax=Sinocyclocheilus rhinocerous TaxID=307959 RepID=A0A673LN36_9TELE
MATEIVAFLLTISGWILISSTLPTDYWKVSSVDGTVITTATFWSNLWKTCVTDSTGVSNCKDFPSMLALDVFLHVCRALAVVSVIFGFWGAVLALIGMKCTKIGGSELANARVTFAAALTYMASSFCGMIVYSWWGNKMRSDFVDPYYLEQKYVELGAALFIGWGGSCLVICGSAVMWYFSARMSFPRSFTKKPRRPPTYMTARTRQTYMLPGSSRPTTFIIPPSHQSYRVNRENRESRGRRGTQESQRQSF